MITLTIVITVISFVFIFLTKYVYEDEIDGLKKSYEQRMKRIDQLLKENAELIETDKKHTSQMSVLRQENKSIREILSDYDQIIKELTSANNNLEAALSSDAHRIDELLSNNAAYANQVSKLGNQIEELKESPCSRLMELVEQTNRPCFITGKAGTGKSMFIQYLKSNTKRNIVLLAPTGIAALNIKGKTIHSFFNIPPVDYIDVATRRTILLNAKTIECIRKLDVLVVDEISMVRPDILDAIDYLLQKYRENGEPFGGVQVIMVGDPYQLRPVINNNAQVTILHNNQILSGTIQHVFDITYGGFFFFHSHVFTTLIKNNSIDFVELLTVYRQNDSDFIQILNAVRVADKANVDFQRLNQYVTDFDKDAICLCTTNAIANSINENGINSITAPEHVLNAELTGTYNLPPSPTSPPFPIPQPLVIKDGALVMIVKNMPNTGWVNGTIGKVFIDNQQQLFVEVNGIREQINKETWQDVNYVYDAESETIKSEVVGSFTQYPIQLAYAITIHKSQGKTFDSINVIADNFFTEGQVYVAISRVRTLEGLHLSKPIPRNSINVDQAVKTFMENTFAPKALKLI